jgi:hypothetical protein
MAGGLLVGDVVSGGLVVVVVVAGCGGVVGGLSVTDDVVAGWVVDTTGVAPSPLHAATISASATGTERRSIA